MSNRLGSLVVSLGLDASEYLRGMSKSEYEAKKTADRIHSQMAGLVKGLAGLGLGAVFVNAVRNAADYGKQIDRLSTLSAASSTEFQKQAYAAKTVGVEMDKLSDIYKDVQDKVGDFMATGGGGMKDFFEQIAPKVGVTADQFARLSGPEALQLYVDSLQKAGVSQNEMVFYLEAIASDATLLLPLLQNNGKAMADLGKEAQDLGRVLDEEAIRATKLLAENNEKLTATMDVASRSIALVFIPAINRMVAELRTGIKYADGFFDALSTFGTAGVFDSPAEGAKKYREELQALRKARDDLVSREGVLANTSGFDRDIAKAEKRVAYFSDLARQGQVFDPSDESTAEAQRLGIKPRTPVYTPPRTKTTKTPKSGKAAGTDPEVEAARQREADMQDLLRDRLGRIGDMERQAAALYQATLSPIERLNQEEANLATLREQNFISEETYWRAREAAQDRYAETLKTVGVVVKEQTEEADNMARRLGDTFAQTFSSAYSSGMKFGDLLKKLAYDAINIQFLTPAAQKAGGILGSVVSSLFSFDGGGYTGSGARSGGLDGKGGFMAMLHPQETVVDHTRGQGAGGGTTIVQNISVDARGADAGVEARIRAAMAQTKAETLAAVQARAHRGGSFASALGRA